jgi:hypothetical protein
MTSIKTADGRILKWNLNNQDGKAGTSFMWLRIQTGDGLL